LIDEGLRGQLSRYILNDTELIGLRTLAKVKPFCWREVNSLLSDLCEKKHPKNPPYGSEIAQDLSPKCPRHQNLVFAQL